MKGRCLPLSNQASMMASTSPNAENQEIRILDQETPRAAPNDDLLRKLLDEVSEIRKENKQLKNEMANLKSSAKRKLFQRPKGSDPECSNAVRKVCKELERNRQQEEDQENAIAFDFKTSFESPANQAMSNKIVSEVRSVYGKKKWEKSAIKASVQQHWRSTRDDKTRVTNSKFEEHRRHAKKNNRLKRKLSRRLRTLERSTTILSDADKEKAREILCSPQALHYMSSEDSEGETTTTTTTNGPKPRKIKKLQWERSKLRNIKAKLDEDHLKGLSEKQRRTTACVRRSDEVSTRPRPNGGPSWAIRTN